MYIIESGLVEVLDIDGDDEVVMASMGAGATTLHGS